MHTWAKLFKLVTSSKSTHCRAETKFISASLEPPLPGRFLREPRGLGPSPVPFPSGGGGGGGSGERRLVRPYHVLEVGLLPLHLFPLLLRLERFSLGLLLGPVGGVGLALRLGVGGGWGVGSGGVLPGLPPRPLLLALKRAPSLLPLLGAVGGGLAVVVVVAVPPAELPLLLPLLDPLLDLVGLLLRALLGLLSRLDLVLDLR